MNTNRPSVMEMEVIELSLRDLKLLVGIVRARVSCGISTPMYKELEDKLTCMVRAGGCTCILRIAEATT